MKQYCCWVLADNKTRCGQPTKYKIVRDDDDNPVRQYDYLCPKHRALSDSLPKTDDDW